VANFVVIGKKLKIVSSVFLAVLLLSFAPPLAALNDSLLSYLGIVWWAVLLGLTFGGLIDYFVPDGFIVHYLGGRRKFTLFYALIAGFLMSACSHGILAIAMQLYKKGASVPAVITFLLASPWANLPVTILLFGFFGWQAILIVLGAMIIALTTGLLYMGLNTLGWIEGSSASATASDTSWHRVSHFDARTAARGVANGASPLVYAVSRPGCGWNASDPAVRNSHRSLQRGVVADRFRNIQQHRCARQRLHISHGRCCHGLHRDWAAVVKYR
jgi:uncharacterized membrane protein YraQ (UPF0718 family)